MRKLLLISLALLFVACGQDEDRKILESENGLVRITAWETPLAGMAGSYNTVLEYEWDGKKHVVRQMDEDSDETVMMPMRLYSIGDNLYLLYQLYRVSSWQVYLEMGAYRMTEDGLQPVDIFDTPDGRASCLSSEIINTTWDYELNEDSGDYWWIYFYNTDKGILYHPLTEEGAITGEFIPYLWNGKVFTPSERTSNPF